MLRIRGPNVKNIIKFSLSTILFLGIAILGYKTISLARDLQNMKRDASELNHLKYGIFSIDAWKSRIETIIADEIEELSLTPQNKKQLRISLEKQLEILIDQIYGKVKKENEKTFSGNVKQSFIESFVDIKKVKSGIPQYAQAMVKEMSSPRTQGQLKQMLKQRISKYMKETFDTRPVNLKDAIVAKYNQPDEESAKKYLAKMVERKHKLNDDYVIYMIALAFLMFGIEFFNKQPLSRYQYFMMTFTLMVMLAVGVTTPMIDMEARITNFEFVLFDHQVAFQDQTLYFQSKSVMDVFHIMITHKEFQMKIVGILMVTFSVVFPVIKMFSSLAYYFNYARARSRKLIQFFVLKSGKWSMADVTVVSIFMAYIGFNGVLNSQLKNVENYSQKAEVITTNGTALQPGFYLFFAYTLLAMFLTTMIEKRPYESRTDSGKKDEEGDDILPLHAKPSASTEVVEYH